MILRMENLTSIVFSASSNPLVSSIYMYIATCFANLNQLIEVGSPYTIITATILKPIFEVLNLNLPTEILDINLLFFNAKTYLYTFYHDLGILGIIVYPMIIYSIIGVLYKKSKTKAKYILLLAALQKSMYTIFFSNYFSGTFGILFPFIVIAFLLALLPSKSQKTISSSTT